MKSVLSILFSLIAFLSSAQELQYTVFFENDRATIPDSAMIYLVRTIHAHSVQAVVIEGHCDSVGSLTYNQHLSDRRAKEVEKLLIENGVAKSAITTCIGYGERKPLMHNSAYDRQLNRRVVVHFTFRDTGKSINANTPVAKKPEHPLPGKALPLTSASQLKAGNTLVLKNLLFYGARHQLKPESIPELEYLCDLLNAHQGVKIEIQGHVCCTTYEADGFDIDTRTDNLSVNRAKVVYDYLHYECGISKDRLRYVGFGGTRKITLDEQTEQQQQINRRVEIKVLEE